MSKISERFRSWFTHTKERLQNTYRLVIMNDETFAEVGSYRLTLLNVYVAMSTIIVIIAVAVAVSIAYTPLKRYIPGFTGKASSDREIYELDRKSVV